VAVAEAAVASVPSFEVDAVINFPPPAAPAAAAPAEEEVDNEEEEEEDDDVIDEEEDEEDDDALAAVGIAGFREKVATDGLLMALGGKA